MFALLQILGDFLPILIVAAAVVAILASGYKKAPPDTDRKSVV